MHRFFVDEDGIQGSTARLEAGDAQHAARVLRLAPGDEVELLDGLCRYAARLTEVSIESVSAEVLSTLPDLEPNVRVTLFQGLPKAEKMEFILQKCTELGVYAVVPVQMERCVVQLSGKDGAKKQERWQRIAREAAKQCGRARVPEVSAPQPLAGLARPLSEDYDLVLVPWEEAREGGIRAAIRETNAQRIAIVIGPEGGMTKEEVAWLAERGARPVTLGPRILRTETAGMAALTMALCLSGQME